MTIKNSLFLFALVFSIASPFTLAQETRYVRDILYIAIRDKAGSGAEVVKAGLTSGTPLKVIEESADGNYALVETQEGERGWAQSQYLSDNPAARDLLEQARTQAAAAVEERDSMAEALSGLETRFTETSASLEMMTKSFNEQAVELDRIKALSNNAVELDQENSQLKSDNERLANNLSAIMDENAQLRASSESSDFWNGILAVLLGCVITLIIPRVWPKKKNEWH